MFNMSRPEISMGKPYNNLRYTFDYYTYIWIYLVEEEAAHSLLEKSMAYPDQRIYAKSKTVAQFCNKPMIKTPAGKIQAKVLNILKIFPVYFFTS